MLITAVASITLAFVLYTVGILTPWFRQSFRFWNLVLLWLGFGLDTTATVLMSLLAGGWKPTVHGWTGLVANASMVVIALWATVDWPRLRGDRAFQKRPYRWVSFGAWCLWLTPFVLGAVFRGKI